MGSKKNTNSADTTTTEAAELAENKVDSLPAPEVREEKPITVKQMVSAICTAMIHFAEGMNAACLDGIRAKSFSLRSLNVFRKLSAAVARNRADLTVKATDKQGERVRITGTLGDTSVELTGIAIPREWSTDVFAVPETEIVALYNAAESAMPG
jgi:hypothetical protein